MNRVVQQRLDFRSEQKLKRGKVRPDSTIDLHGLDQKAADDQLKRFLIDSYEDGSRTVLVITGKGRGVLRQHAANLFESPAMSRIIAFFSDAPRSMGGNGGYILRLRKNPNKPLQD